jgi:hypothetical protein
VQDYDSLAQSVSGLLVGKSHLMLTVLRDLDKLRREWYLSGEANNVLTPKERYKLDLVLFVYWTCLQLESYVLVLAPTRQFTNTTKRYRGRNEHITYEQRHDIPEFHYVPSRRVRKFPNRRHVYGRART